MGQLDLEGTEWGRKVNPGLTEQPVSSRFCTSKVARHREGQEHQAGRGQAHQPRNSQIGFVRIAGGGKGQQRKGECVLL